MVTRVGILNITPDSFSDGGKYTSYQAALNHAQRLIDDGADIIDVGAQSTRPGAIMLDKGEDWQRLNTILPDIINLAHKHHCKVSIDTIDVTSAKHAIDLGIDMINDQQGLDDHNMQTLVLTHHIPVVVMHHLGLPANKNKTLPKNCNPIEEVKKWINHKKQTLDPNTQCIFDPGIGFGKTAQQSAYIIEHIDKLTKLDVPIYVGHSRKSFLNYLYPTISKSRDPETHEISRQLIKKGVDYIRVHDVKKDF
tara:strand:- start:578 stop:1330 length:753 start_codon:yes stop_codon:yes gene_type:complete